MPSCSPPPLVVRFKFSLGVRVGLSGMRVGLGLMSGLGLVTY